jgi:putative ABC transport system ATP-binding protein
MAGLDVVIQVEHVARVDRVLERGQPPAVIRSTPADRAGDAGQLAVTEQCMELLCDATRRPVGESPGGAAGSCQLGERRMSDTTDASMRDGQVARAVGVSKIYGSGDTAILALDDITVGFPRGQFSAVMGPSGSGKSTLLHCLAGLDRVTSGEVWIGDAELGRLSERQLTLLRRTSVGFVFQAFNLLPTLTAGENITLPLDLAGNAPEPEWYDRVLTAVGLRDRLRHRPAELSGGEQQRVAGARALVSRPLIIFADEPTGNLDSRSSAEILAFMRRSVDEFGQTIVMVTHDPAAAAYADRVVFLADGRVEGEMLDPTAEKVLDSMKRLGD